MRQPPPEQSCGGCFFSALCYQRLMRAERASLLTSLLILLLAVSGLYLNCQRGLLADDDNLWLMFASEKIAAPQVGAALENRAVELVTPQGVSDASLRRITDRENYFYNYALPVVAWHGLSKLVTPPETPQAYPAYVARLLSITLPVTSLICWLILIGMIFRLQDHRLRLAATAGLSLIAALMLLPNHAPMMTLLGFNSFQAGLRNALAFVLNPWHGFSVYSFTPRNNLAVLVIGIFLLRWSGRMRAAYLMMLPLYSIHSSLSLLVTVHLLALDLLRQRQVLRDPAIISAVIIGMGYGLWRETLWNAVGNSSVIITCLLAMLLGLLWVIWSPRPLLILDRYRQQLENKLNTLPAPAADALLLVSFWAISLPPNYLISLHMDPLQNLYFWHQLQGRAIGAMASVVFIGFAYALPTGWLTRFTALFTLIWLVGFGYLAATRETPYATALKQASLHEAYLSGEISADNYPYLSGPGFVLPEQALYYTLDQMMVLHNDRWQDLQRIAIPGGR